MSDPFTAVLMAVGTAVTAAGQISAGQNQAAIAERNAQIARREAQYREQVAAQEEARLREDRDRLLGKQRAAIGGSGIDFTGSPLLALEETARNAELDALTIRYGGAAEAARLRTQAQTDRAQASAYTSASYINAGATILGGGAKISDTLAN